MSQAAVPPVVTLTGARRIWCLAMALTGSEPASERILTRMLARFPDLEAIGESRLDQVVVIEARDDQRQDTTPLGRLDLRVRETWVLIRVFGVDEIAACRSLGLARGPIEEFLRQGDQRTAHALGVDRVEQAAEAMRAAFLSLDPGAALERARQARAKARTRRRLVTLAQIVIGLVIAGLLGFVLIDMLGWDERQAELKRRADELAIPMPTAPPSTGELADP